MWQEIYVVFCYRFYFTIDSQWWIVLAVYVFFIVYVAYVYYIEMQIFIL